MSPLQIADLGRPWNGDCNRAERAGGGEKEGSFSLAGLAQSVLPAAPLSTRPHGATRERRGRRRPPWGLEIEASTPDERGMKFRAAALILVAAGCGGKDDGGGGASIMLPKVYPAVRAVTPAALIADPAYAQALTAIAQLDPGDTMPGSNPDAGMILPDGGSAPNPGGTGPNPGDTMPGNMNPGGMPGEVSLGMAVQQRFYSPGPTSLLRIVKDLDDRVAGLDPRPAKHPCLTAAPIARTFALPGGQTFTVKLQCLDSHGSDWVAFGFGTALAPSDAGASDDDAGVPDGGALGADGGGDDFFLVQGQSTGNGGAYHVKRSTGDVEGWITVADSQSPGNSQVVMHLLTNKAAGTLELVLGGSAVGFCGAHLMTGADAIYVRGQTNAAPPPGAPAGSQACAATRAGCFAASSLAIDLGAMSATCGAIGDGAFRITTDLDASPGASANVTPGMIHTYFSTVPAGVPAF
jgi:hypothetical protein